MSALEDQTPKASSSHQPYNPLQFTPIAPKAITERPHLEATHSESELEHDSVMADILSRCAQSYEPQAEDSPDPLTFPLGLMHSLGTPRVRNAPGSTTSSRQRVDTREYRRRRPALSQEQYEYLLAAIIRYGKLEFEAQRAEIINLRVALLAQAKTITEHQAAHKIICDGAKATYDELTILRQQVKDEITPLKGEAAGQKEAVERLTDKIKAALVIQWEALIKKLGEENDKIIGEA